MPIYSLVALVLSLFGASYTAISTIKSYFDVTLKDIYSGVNRKMDVINEAHSDAGDVTVKEAADGYAKGIARAYAVWRYSNIIPIVVFIVVVFMIAIVCLFCWNMVIQSPSSSMSNPSGFTSQAGWWVLLIAIAVNGSCTIGAWISKNTIKGHGKHLGELHKSAEKALANRSLGAQGKSKTR